MKKEVTIPQPRKKYNFGEMKKNDIKKFLVTIDDPDAGERARTAAYAYARRNDVHLCSAVSIERGKEYMVIRRVA